MLSQVARRQIAQELHAVEISESGVKAIGTKEITGLKTVQLFDGYNIPYPDKTFDLATVVHVLEHVEHERLFLREIRRVSRRVYIEVPLEHNLKIRRVIAAGKKYGHINFYMKETFRNLLESVGLEIIKCETFASSLDYEVHLSGVMKGRLKHAARRMALMMAPNHAPLLISYNCYALCDCA